jgi:hypothetical protein
MEAGMRRLGISILCVALSLGTSARGGVAQPLSPLVVDWEQYFRIESVSALRGGRAVVTGTVWNTAPWSTKKIQLLVDALDAGGEPITQRVIWLGVDLAAGTHAAFEVPMPPAPSYRVRVFAFDSGRGGRWS